MFITRQFLLVNLFILFNSVHCQSASVLQSIKNFAHPLGAPCMNTQQCALSYLACSKSLGVCYDTNQLGKMGGVCTMMKRCDAGLICVTFSNDPAADGRCFPMAKEGNACNQIENPVPSYCAPGLACKPILASIPGQTFFSMTSYRCMKIQHAPGQVCVSTQDCDQGFACLIPPNNRTVVNGTCYPTAKLNEPCGVGKTAFKSQCANGLACSSDSVVVNPMSNHSGTCVRPHDAYLQYSSVGGFCFVDPSQGQDQANRWCVDGLVCKKSAVAITGENIGICNPQAPLSVLL